MLRLYIIVNLHSVGWIKMHFPMSVPDLLRNMANLATFHRLAIKTSDTPALQGTATIVHAAGKCYQQETS